MSALAWWIVVGCLVWLLVACAVGPLLRRQLARIPEPYCPDCQLAESLSLGYPVPDDAETVARDVGVFRDRCRAGTHAARDRQT